MKNTAPDNSKQDKTKPDKVQSPNLPLNDNRIWPALTVDVALFQHHLDSADLTDEQKDAFLLNLWNMMVCFVDLGFGVHPLQQADTGECGQSLNLTDILTQGSANMVECSKHPKAQFNDIADTHSGASSEMIQGERSKK